MKYCTYCGKVIENDSESCPNCGAHVPQLGAQTNTPTSTSSGPQTVFNPAMSNTSGNQGTSYSPTPYPAPTGKKGLNKKIIIGICSAVAVFAVTIVIIVVLVSGKSANKYNGNYNNSNSYSDNGKEEFEGLNNDDYTDEAQDLETSADAHTTQVPDGYIGIYTVDDLLKADNNRYADYILMNDIDLSSIDNWEGIRNFGTFDGNNYTISNLKSTHSGLFASFKNLINIKVENAVITNSGSTVGIIANIASSYDESYHDFTVSNCSASGTIYFTDFHSSIDVGIGGIIGKAHDESTVNIFDCTSRVDYIINTESVTNTGIGGIVGYIGFVTNANVSNCYNYGNVILKQDKEFRSDVGGIVGETNSNKSLVINNCVNYGSLESQHTAHWKGTGGVVGTARKDKINITNCCNTGKIQSSVENKGSIIGYIDDAEFTISQCEYVKNSEYGLNDLDAVGGNVLIPSNNAVAISLNEAKQKYHF